MALSASRCTVDRHVWLPLRGIAGTVLNIRENIRWFGRTSFQYRQHWTSPSIHSETFGSSHAQLAPVFIAHGMLGSCNNWTSMARRLQSATGRQVVTFDARNHGRSGHSDTMTYRQMSDDLLRVIDGHRQQEESKGRSREVVLMGHSMGGRTAMYAALKNPSLVSRLIVVDVSPVNVQFDTMDATEWNMSHFFHALKAVRFLQSGDVENWSMSKTRMDADAQLSHRIKDAGLRSWLLMNMVHDPVTRNVRWRHNLDAIQRAFELDVRTFPHDDFQPFQRPTLFIGGADSEYIPVADHPEIRELFPTAAFEYVKGAGHWVHSQKPDEFLEIVLKYL